MKFGIVEGDPDRRHFHCPGCEYVHSINVGRNGWVLSGTEDSPTVSPSILATGAGVLRCHSFIEGGKIRFLTDCDHSLAGQTVELPDWY